MPNGVLSGRIPEMTTDAPFATLDMSANNGGRKNIDTQRYQDVSKNLFGSPTNTLGVNTRMNQTLTSGRDSLTSKHKRRRTINGLSAITLNGNKK